MKKLKIFLISILSAMLMLTFSACAPNNLAKAQSKMNGAGYKTQALTTAELNAMFIGVTRDDMDAIGGISCYKENSTDALIAIWFEEGEEAKEFEQKFAFAKEDFMGEISPADFVAERAGAVYYFGTANAVKDFTK